MAPDHCQLADQSHPWPATASSGHRMAGGPGPCPMSHLSPVAGEVSPPSPRAARCPPLSLIPPASHQLLLPASSMPVWDCPTLGRAGSAAAPGSAGSPPVSGPSSSSTPSFGAWPGGLLGPGSGWMLLEHRRALEATAAPWESLLPAVTLFCFLPFSIHKLLALQRHKIGYFKGKLPCPQAWEVGAKCNSQLLSQELGQEHTTGQKVATPTPPPLLPALSCTPEEAARPAGTSRYCSKTSSSIEVLNKAAESTLVVAASGGGKRVG